MKTAVIVFPGSNCDRDMAVAIEDVSGEDVLRVWHGDAELPDRLDFIALPGGFSYGDYLRSGAMAARSPILRAVSDAAARGVPAAVVLPPHSAPSALRPVAAAAGLTIAGRVPGAELWVRRPSPP